MRERVKNGLRLAPALIVAALGWQIGERAWRAPAAPPVAYDLGGRPSPPGPLWEWPSPSGPLWERPLPPGPLSQYWERGPEGEGHFPGGGRGGGGPLIAGGEGRGSRHYWADAGAGLPPPSEIVAPAVRPPAPGPPSEAVAAHREERFVGPIFAPGPEYEGKPLPLPTPDQVRFLLRREPIAALRPAAPLAIAPPAAGERPPATAPPGAPRGPPPGPSSSGARVAMGPRLPVGPPAPAAGGATRVDASEPAEKERRGLEKEDGEAGAPGGSASGEAGAPGTERQGPAATINAEGGARPDEKGEALPAEGASGERAAPGTSPAGNGAAPVGKAGGEEGPTPGAAVHEGPLRLRLRMVAGRPHAGVTTQASVQITASAPCHVAAYQVDAAGQVTPLLPASGAARMPAVTSLRLATRPGKESGGVRVVALASRQPLSARALYRCLLAFLAAPHADLDPAPAGASVPSAADAFTAVSGYLARHVGAGATSDPLPERALWDVGVSPTTIPTARP